MKPEFSDSAEFYKRHLRPFLNDKNASESVEVSFGATLPELIETFRKTTGFDLIFIRNSAQIPQKALAVVPIPCDDQTPIGSLILSRLPEKLPMLEMKSALLLTESIAQILGESFKWSRALRHRESELAVLETGSAFTVPPFSTLADRFPLILKQGAKAIGCEAAALYLLNQETTSLKLRSVWGLPTDRLTAPPRFLGRAMADLEALLGNAVVLNEPYLFEEWNAPEYFSASVCVPVASESTILGTAWFFTDRKQDFNRRDLHVLEMVTGRLAVELEFQFLKDELNKNRAPSTTHASASRPSTAHASADKPADSSGVSDAPSVPCAPPIDIPPTKEEASISVESDSVPERGAVSRTPLSAGPTPEKEAEDFLNLLEKHLEKKGNCKNLTLFVVKSSPIDPSS